MERLEIAAALDEMADLSDLAGETPFKGRAYRKAAEAIRSFDGDLDGAIESAKLREIPGIGEAIFEKVKALRCSGTHPTLEKLRAAVPAGLREIYRRSGLGARKVIALRGELGVATPSDLAKALADGRVAGVKGFDRRTIDRLSSIFGGRAGGGAT